jgi:hypothetical protein
MYILKSSNDKPIRLCTKTYADSEVEWEVTEDPSYPLLTFESIERAKLCVNRNHDGYAPDNPTDPQSLLEKVSICVLADRLVGKYSRLFRWASIADIVPNKLPRSHRFQTIFVVDMTAGAREMLRKTGLLKDDVTLRSEITHDADALIRMTKTKLKPETVGSITSISDSDFMVTEVVEEDKQTTIVLKKI